MSDPKFIDKHGVIHLGHRHSIDGHPRRKWITACMLYTDQLSALLLSDPRMIIGVDEVTLVTCLECLGST